MIILAIMLAIILLDIMALYFGIDSRETSGERRPHFWSLAAHNQYA